MNKLETLLNKKFPSDIVQPLVALVQRSYRANADCHDPALGHNDMTYAFLNYITIKRLLSLLAEKENWIKIEKHGPQFIFRIGGFRMSHYRAGDSSNLHPEESFPRNRNGAVMFAKYNKNQLTLFNLWDEKSDPQVDDLPEVILAHKGNFELGLNSVFLGIPADYDDNDQITRWEATKLLWQKGDEADFLDLPVSPNNATPSEAPVERILPPKLSIKTAKKAAGEK